MKPYFENEKCDDDKGHFEVMSLTKFNADKCWDSGNRIKVKLLDATLTVTIHGNLEERE